jgi:inward rectifier potassium channel
VSKSPNAAEPFYRWSVYKKHSFFDQWRSKSIGNLKVLRPDGSINVVKRGRGWWRTYDLYHKLLSMSWLSFVGIILIGYVSANLVFSMAYMMIGMDSLAGVEGVTRFEQFLDSFFFSAQTITTLGYGRIAPVGTAASTVAAIESMVGLLGFAVGTGLLYGRFSRPVARIKFSEKAIVAPYEEGKAMMFRMANERSSQLIEVEVQVTLSYVDRETGKRDWERLTLELDKIILLALSWTVVHPIDEKSPFWNLDHKGLEAMDAEMIIIVKAFDDSFGTTVYQRMSYKFWEIEFGKKFTSMVVPDSKSIHLDMAKVGEYADA